MGVRSPVTALLAVAVLAGCAIPIDDQARNLVAELPDALLPAASTTTEAPGFCTFNFWAFSLAANARDCGASLVSFKT